MREFIILFLLLPCNTRLLLFGPSFFLFVFLFDHFSVSSLPQCPPLTIILDGDSHWGEVSISWCCFSSLIVTFFSFFASFDWNQRLLPAYFAPRIRNLSTFYIGLHSESTHDSPNVSTHAHLHSQSICLAASQLQCAVFFANEACQRQKCEAPPVLLHLVHRVESAALMNYRRSRLHC